MATAVFGSINRATPGKLRGRPNTRGLVGQSPLPKRPAVSPSYRSWRLINRHPVTAVHAEIGAMDVGRQRTGQENNGSSDLFRSAEALQRGVDKFCRGVSLYLSPIISPSLLLSELAEKCLRTGSDDGTGAYGIDSNTGAAHLFSQTGRDQNIGGFGSGIIRHSSHWLKTGATGNVDHSAPAIFLHIRHECLDHPYHGSDVLVVEFHPLCRG